MMRGMADRGTGLWRAIAWAEGLLLLGLVGVGLAAASTFQSCDLFGDCTPGGTWLDSESVVWLVPSGVALASGIFIATWASGWSGARAVVQATVALGASAVALGLGGIASVWLVDEYLPALVLSVGVAGIVAIRPTFPGAVTARLVVLAILVLLALGVATIAAVTLLTLLTLPAMGAVESAIRPTEP